MMTWALSLVPIMAMSMNLMIPRARIGCCKVLGPSQSLRHILDVLGRVNALLGAAIHFTIVSTDAPRIRPLVWPFRGHKW
jgi:hypothetical protein